MFSQTKNNPQISKLTLMTQEELLNFFKRDIEAQDEEAVLKKLKLRMMLLAASERDSLKKKILENF